MCVQCVMEMLYSEVIFVERREKGRGLVLFVISKIGYCWKVWEDEVVLVLK